MGLPPLCSCPHPMLQGKPSNTPHQHFSRVICKLFAIHRRGKVKIQVVAGSLGLRKQYIWPAPYIHVTHNNSHACSQLQALPEEGYRPGLRPTCVTARADSHSHTPLPREAPTVLHRHRGVHTRAYLGTHPQAHSRMYTCMKTHPGRGWTSSLPWMAG